MRYLRDNPDTDSAWEGSNFVFDQRSPVEPEVTQEVGEQRSTIPHAKPGSDE